MTSRVATAVECEELGLAGHEAEIRRTELWAKFGGEDS